MTGVEPLAVVRAVHIAATIAVAGALAFRLLVLPRARERARHIVDAPVATVAQGVAAWCGAALTLCVLSWLAWLAVTASGMSGLAASQALDPDLLRTVLGRTTFGRIWTLRAVCMLLLAACLGAMRTLDGRKVLGVDTVAACLGAVLLVTLSATGHAVAADPSERPLRLAADAVHALAAGAWLGALVPLLTILSRARASAEPSWQAFAAVVSRRFSALGVVSMVLLLGSGLVNASWLVGSWAALVATPYGRLVALKVALFVLILATAAVNRFRLTPRLRVPSTRRGAVRRLWFNVIAELGIGASIVAVVGLLGVTPPSAYRHSGDPHEMHEHEKGTDPSSPANGRSS